MKEYSKEAVKREIENFETADKYKTNIHVGNLLEHTKMLLGTLDIVCPHCNYNQRTENFVSRKCLKCGRKFEIFPVNDFSRLAMSEWNMERIHLIHQYYHLKKTGRLLI